MEVIYGRLNELNSRSVVKMSGKARIFGCFETPGWLITFTRNFELHYVVGWDEVNRRTSEITGTTIVETTVENYGSTVVKTTELQINWTAIRLLILISFDSF